MDFPRIRQTFGVTPYNPDRDTDEKRRAIFEHYQSQMGAQPLPEETLPWNKPFPPGVAMQEGFDDMLQRRVVDPLAQAGFEGMGAGLAAIPSAAHSMIVPQTEFDIAGTIIPLPGVAKAMKKGKFRKIRNAMKAEDPENVGKIIAEQAGKEGAPYLNPDEKLNKQAAAILRGESVDEVLGKLNTNPPSTGAEVRAIDEKEILRKADEANAREKQVDKDLRTTEPASDWTKLKDNADYIFEGRKIKGKDLREELLQMSTGDFHTAKWEPYDPKKDMFKVDQKRRMKDETFRIEADARLKESELDALDKEVDKINAEIDQLNPSDPDYNIMVDKRVARLEEIEAIVDKSLKGHQRNLVKVVEPPKGPKGDPEGNPFRRIRDAMEGLEKYSVNPNDKYYQEWLKVKDSYRGTYKNWLKERMKKDQE